MTYYCPPGARALTTRPMKLFAGSAPFVQSIGGIMVVDGEPGHGKTNSVEGWRLALRERTTHIELGERPAGAEVVTRLLENLGIAYPPRAPAWKLKDVLCQGLAGVPAVLVIDEAQQLGISGMKMLRSLHDRPDACWTMVLVGVGLTSTISKHRELVSRVAATVNFSSLRPDELLSALPRYHPLFQGVSEELLLDCDATLGQIGRGTGNLRSWAVLTGTAVSVLQGRGLSVAGDGALAALDPRMTGAFDAKLAGICIGRLSGAGSTG